ncbi:N-methyl-D-aspartate receptor NMDAR2C subunit [Comamonas sp. Y33R10-2]|uniref:HD domain-containing protein n=1 Tax=Comamonas sp. Y33R10-2 TaxID=2853257 RepID=UPI001C5C8725|nr:N-methyl-D-aspartate receptor NMDAR2C subunit [Comamonas sp. Y33R10-2]QXZ11178.1 N-methyl-D-aspartate receptor NMDAR2C subunit [Comamonas sp. Y33R10-2]
MSTEPAQLFQTSWQRCWAHLNLTAPADLQQCLLAAYAEPQRHYHTQQHLAECLAHFDAAEQQAQHPGEVAIALWFHDAIYDIKAKDNELRSAEWAVRVLKNCGAAQEVCQRVHALIMATCHTVTPVEPDAKLLVDIDLAILGASPERFAEYDEQVAAEYSWVPRWVYAFKRKQVLKSFLQRDAIYTTPHFHQRLEAQARRNLGQI